jgi:peptide/nickel transport system substrate-binding protein
MSKRYWLVLTISGVLLIALLITSCSNAASTTTQAPVITTTAAPVTTSKAPIATSQAPIITTASAPIATVKKGGTLKLGVPAGPTALGLPETGSVSNDALLSAPCIEQLSSIDGKGNITPWLAEGWTVDTQTATVTLTLRKGVKFHDGTIMNAAAIKDLYEYHMPLKTTSTKNIKSIDILDDYKLRLNLIHWDADAVSDATSLFVVSPTALKTQGDAWAKQHPIGTGPFKFVSHQVDVSVKYIALDDYWGGKPYLNGIEYYMIKDTTTRLNSFLAGEVDVCVDPSTPQVQQMTGNSKYYIRDSKGVGAFVFLIGDGANADSPFSKLQVRQAMGYALNRESLVKNVLGGSGMVANQHYPEGTWAQNPNMASYNFDPGKAKQLLAEAGYASGFDTTITCATHPYAAELTNAMQAMLNDVGIRAKINQLSMAAYINYTQDWKNGIIYFQQPPNPNKLSYSSTYVYDVDPTGPQGCKRIYKNQELTDAIRAANAAVDTATRQPLAWKWADLTFNKYAQVTPVVITSNRFIAYTYVKDLPLYTAVTPNSYHVETTWLDK